VPALRAAGEDLVPAIKGSEVAGHRGRTRRVTFSRVLVVGQIATSLLLLVLSGLFARSITGALAVDPGFRTDNRLVVRMQPSLVGYDGARATTYYRAVLERLARTPAISSASLTQHVPLGVGGHSTDVAIEGRVAAPGEEKVETRRDTVDENYFRTLGVRLVAGRAFDEHDDASSRPVVIVNETFARRYWPGGDPLGKRLQVNAPNGPWLEVVGTAADGKYEALFEPRMTCIWVPYRQHPRPDMCLVAEARGDISGAASALRRQITAVDANVPVFAVKTMKQHLERQQVVPTLLASLVVPAGVLALLIAVIGLYAVMAYSVGRRTREIGIRVAIGAAPSGILRLVLREGMVLTAAGTTIGLVLAFALTRTVSAILTGVSPTDPLVFTAVPAVLLGVAALACCVPARRAVSVDPLVALRQE
jgi:predicted permease